MLKERELVHELDHDTVARCKAFGHRWSDTPTPPNARHRSTRSTTALHFRCDRCGMLKVYMVDNRSGEGHGYYYPPSGYSDWKSSRRDWKVTWAWTFRSKVKEAS